MEHFVTVQSIAVGPSYPSLEIALVALKELSDLGYGEVAIESYTYDEMYGD